MDRRRFVTDRPLIESWLRAALDAADPEVLTDRALTGRTGPVTVVAIGKAAPAMCRGAARALGSIDGLCVTNHEAEVPAGVELMLGDHPIPGENSARAARRALELAPRASLALISGGGSALCELPVAGIEPSFVAEVNRTMLREGASIEEMNLVRSHLSAVKGGGLGPLPTYVLSDVGAAGPSVVSSGPTIPTESRLDEAIVVMRSYAIEPPAHVIDSMSTRSASPVQDQLVQVVGDGRTAAIAAVAAVSADIATARVQDGWLDGPTDAAVEEFVRGAGAGITVAVGETTLHVRGEGTGGRNTHAALLAARLIAGTSTKFAALATDGVDGNSRAAGAIVDGLSLARGGDSDAALAHFDSATYLRRSGDLLDTGPTGTNVADLWLVWAPE